MPRRAHGGFSSAGKKELKRAAWRPREWREAVGVSHGTMQRMVNSGAIPTRLVTPRLRLILVSPEDFAAGKFAPAA